MLGIRATYETASAPFWGGFETPKLLPHQASDFASATPLFCMGDSGLFSRPRRFRHVSEHHLYP